MKRKRLKNYVLPTVYVVILILLFGAVSIVSTFMKTKGDYLYSVNVLNGSTTTVVSPDENLNNDDILAETKIIKPFVSDAVSIDKYFYNITDEAEKQEQSLIYFENTYMKNTGVLYKCDSTFDVVVVLDGEVKNIFEDDIMGNVIEIEHNTNLSTIYYGLGKIDLKVGDKVVQGDIIGTSGISKISPENNNLLFEVYYNGNLIDPIAFYEMSLKDLG